MVVLRWLSFTVEGNCVRAALTIRSAGSIRMARILACVACLMFVCSTAFSADRPDEGQPAPLSPAERKKLTVERDAFLERAVPEFQAQGKLREAIAAAQSCDGHRATRLRRSLRRRGSLDRTDRPIPHDARRICPSASSGRAMAGDSRQAPSPGRLAADRRRGWCSRTSRLASGSRLRKGRNWRVAEQVDAQALQFYQKGSFPQSIKSASQAFDIRRRILGDANPLVVESRYHLGTLYYRTGQYPNAVKELSESCQHVAKDQRQ